MSHRFNKSRAVWSFTTSRFTVALYVERDRNYIYDGDDEDGSYQEKIDSGEIVAFDSRVVVTLDGEEIASNWLCGSTYGADEVDQFWTAHRDADPMNRNSSVMREARGHNVVICHYFPDMVRETISAARDHVAAMAVPPRLRVLA